MRFQLMTVLSLLTAASSAHAATVIPILTKTIVSIDGGPNVEQTGLPTSYSEQSVNDPDYAAKVTAFQNQTGFSQIALDITSYESGGGPAGGSAADGNPGHSLSATSFLVLDFLNDGPIAESVTFNFTLSNLSLHTFNAAGDPGPLATLQFGAVNTGAGRGAGPNFDAAISLRGNFDAPSIENASGFTAGPLVKTSCVIDICYGADLMVNDLSDQLFLGTIDPGERAQVTVFLSGLAQFDGFEMGAEVFAIDPSGGSAFSYSVSSTPVSPVPLPAGALFSLSGLACLAGLRRRKRRTE